MLNFRHWLEEHDLTRALFDEVGSMLEERGLLMRQGTIVDATIIAAPPLLIPVMSLGHSEIMSLAVPT